jgi:hypothetical protein
MHMNPRHAAYAGLDFLGVMQFMSAWRHITQTCISLLSSVQTFVLQLVQCSGHALLFGWYT